MYHYTYRITNIIDKKHYYGARSCKCLPSEDLGIKYFSSSSDNDFIFEQKNDPKKFKYKVISIFETRAEALDLEIKLHEKFEVHKNPKFYNKAKQTSKGFNFISDGSQFKNHVTVKDSNGKSFNVSKTDKRYLSGELKALSKGRVIVINLETKKKFTMTKDEFENSPSNIITFNAFRGLKMGHKGNNRLKIYVYDRNDNLLYDYKTDEAFHIWCANNKCSRAKLLESAKRSGEGIYTFIDIRNFKQIYDTVKNNFGMYALYENEERKNSFSSSINILYKGELYKKIEWDKM